MTVKPCPGCQQQKSTSEFSIDSRTRDGLRSWCKSCNSAAAKARYHAQPFATRTERSREWAKTNRSQVNQTAKAWRQGTGSVSEMLSQAKKRAKTADIPFNVTAADVLIPERCPVFGMPLVRADNRGPSPWSPSLDKIIPANGYVPGNVRVLSHKANVMKSDASPEELLLFADWIYQTFGLLRKE